jgi:hypothetical protein
MNKRFFFGAATNLESQIMLIVSFSFCSLGTLNHMLSP